MKQSLFILVAVLMFSNGYAQKLTGSLKDAIDESPLIRATVTLLKTDSTSKVSETVSSNNGSFALNDAKPGKYILRISSIGYGITMIGVNLPSSGLDMGEIKIHKSAETLSDIVISGAPPPVRMKGDTTEFSASQFKVNPDATTEDLIKKMPGVTVDSKGTVTAQGETVKKVTVDGRDFFGDDATATLRNLPSEVVDKIQVFDRLSDQAQLTGFDDGNTSKSINIVTKANMRQGNFGRIYAGYGTDDRYAGGGNISFFNNARRISIIGLTNNINQQNFSSEDLVGASGGGGGRRGGGGGGRWGGGGDFFVGQQSGISKTNSLGINFSDAWGKKVDVTASYFFNNSKLNNIQTINRENLQEDSSTFNDNSNISQSENYNHRFNLRLNYKIDSNNTLLFTTNASLQSNNSIYDELAKISGADHQKVLSATENSIKSNLFGANINTGLLFSHAFARKGRSISLGFYTGINSRNGDNYNKALNTYYKVNLVTDTVNRYTDNKNNTNNYNLNLVYTEPLAEKTQLQVNYNPSFQTSSADQETFDFENGKYGKLNTTLSNKFESNYNTQNAGITVRHGDRNNMIAGGISYQHSDLKSNQVFPEKTDVHYTFENFLANAFGRFKIGKYGSIRTFYRGSVNSPSVTQLQNVINTSNQLFYTAGNPDLKQQYTHRGMLRYSYANRLNSTSFFGSFYVSGINNYISNATYTASKDSVLADGIILRRFSQLSKPVNLNGYISARSFYAYSMPLKFMKTNLNVNGGFGYARQPGLLNNVKNISNNYNYSIGAGLASNISEYVDFDISYSANFNNVKNSITPEKNDKYVSQSARISFNLLSKKGTFLQNSLSNESYSGLADGFNQSYWLWNIAVGQKFLKAQRGEIKLSVFDLLKQNKSITRDVTESYIQDTRNQVLQQFFMLTFTYKLRNFGKAPARNERSGSHNFGGMGMPPPPPMH